MKTSSEGVYTNIKLGLSFRTVSACLVVLALSLAAIPVRAGDAEDKARQAFADWKAANKAVQDATGALDKAREKQQIELDKARYRKKNKKKGDAQDKQLADARAEVAAAEAALENAEALLLIARAALEKAIAELPDGELKDQLKRERNFPSLVPANGLYVVKFDTPNGQLKLNLPDDIRAGDTISGTVIAEPKGKTEEERNRNRGVLNGYVVGIADQRYPVDKGTVGPFVIRGAQTLSESGTPPPPPQLNSFFDVFVAVDLSTSPLGPVRIPLFPSGVDRNLIPPPHPGTIPPETDAPRPRTLRQSGTDSFEIPTIGQQGRTLEIAGPFDGNSSNTTLNVTGSSGAPLLDRERQGPRGVSVGFGLLAESPRKAVFQSPTDVTGPMEVTVKEGDKQTTGNYRNVGVNLSAPKTSLLKGESTELKVQVRGLEGIKAPVPLTLESQGVITMTGGNYQPLTIQPSQVAADGSYTTTRGITGLQAGGWTATATVVTRPQ